MYNGIDQNRRTESAAYPSCHVCPVRKQRCDALGKRLTVAIALSLAILVCLTSANLAFAWLTDSMGVIDDFSLSDFQEPAYVALYGSDTLAFGRGDPAESYEGKALSATYRGIETGEDDFGPSMVGNYPYQSNSSRVTCAPWYANIASITTVVSLTEETIRPRHMVGWFCRSDYKDNTALSNVDLSCIDTSHCVSMEWLFCGCVSLKHVDVSNWRLDQCRSIRSMFYGCRSLEALDVSRWNVENLSTGVLGRGYSRSLEHAFYGCAKLETIDTSNWNLKYEGWTYPLSAFSRCSALKVLDIRGFNMTPSGSNKGFADEFHSLTSLERMVLPYYTSTYYSNPYPTPQSGIGGVSNSSYWYIEGSSEPMSAWEVKDHQDELAQQYLSGTLPFGFTTYIASKDFSDDDAWAALYGNDILVFGRGTASSAPVDFSGRQQTAFYREVESPRFTRPWPDSLVEVMFLAEIRPSTCSGWFSNETSLQTIQHTDNLHTENVSNMSSMFSGCTSLTELDISMWDTRSVTSFESMFFNCRSLQHIYCNGLDTSNAMDMSFMFKGCSALVSADISGFDVGNVRTFQEMFRNCISMETVELPKNSFTSSIQAASSENGYTNKCFMNAFAGCSCLKEIDLSFIAIPNDWGSADAQALAGLLSGDIALEKIVVPTTLRNMNDNAVWFPERTYPFADKPQYTVMWKLQSDGKRYSNVTQFNIGSYLSNDHVRFAYGSPERKINALYGSGQQPQVWTREIVNCESYAAVYGDADGDKTLVFGRGETMAEYGGKELLAEYREVENRQQTCPWKQFSNQIIEIAYEFPDDLFGFRPKYMNQWFKEIAVRQMDVAQIDTSLVNDMSSLFAGSWNLESIEGLESWNVSHVTSMSSMFACENLKDCAGIETWTKMYVRDASWMFWGCDIASLDLSQWLFYPTTIVSMFYQCTELEELVLPDTLGAYLAYADSLSQVFWGCQKLRFVDLSSWEICNITSLYGLFYDCFALEGVGDISAWNTSKVVNMQNVFHNCYILTADCTNWDVSNVVEHDYTFNYCAPNIQCPQWSTQTSLENNVLSEEERGGLQQVKGLPLHARHVVCLNTDLPMTDRKECPYVG